MARGLLTKLIAAATITAALSGCGEADFTDAEKRTIASMSLSALAPLAPDPTNSFADDPGAAALGATLFFDTGMSRDGNVACGTCHKIDRQFQDDLPRGVGVGETNRRTMPLAGVARDPFFFWDGRRDSLWSQALVPLENVLEHAGTRTAYAHYLKRRFGERYERIFRPLPDLSTLPASAGPFGTPAEKAAWAGMSDAQREGVDRIFSDIGKAIAAFERSLVHGRTRFDRFADAVAQGRAPSAEDTLSAEERQGLRLFIGKANCSTCHTGPRFTDNHFHNTAVPPVAGLPADRGRIAVVDEVLADPFNCLGKFRDGGEEACGELRFMQKRSPELLRAYKTPSLRNVAGRAPYMHAGQFATLEQVVINYANAPKSVEGESEIHSVALSEGERAALVAFLKTLGD
ncbi:cytochrome c peroxidase [Aminobacter aminovorans]|jgi:cytochrome c peroxidase|uniref:Cytochrome c551 peroxidase n=1 Tax=Aminobacter aminovorans TaxID=83263 RepID=A0A380WMY1_AMIAI|nr:cytochrome c peroxidase [Aminobacter aminovorans]TCS28034.1 cytochrome c peroxidase [Aminobacter aminovorans]SUU89554.1 Cytochrome c551 peroxidase precursor [Aminobacter aminovorans]